MFSHVHAVALLVGTAAVGVVAHELSHLVALRLAGISCTVEVLPGRSDGRQFSAGVGSPLARVRPTRLPADVSPWALRWAALTPLGLAVPLALVLVGVLPDPFASGTLVGELALVVWVGCSIPSPQDFSVAWYPERAIATADVPVEGALRSDAP